jgi:hypothetical protein
MSLSSRLRRLIWLIPLGIVLAAISGYIGAIVLPQAIAVWVALLFLKAITMQASGFFVVLAGPALHGLLWCWPVTCVALPLASLAVRSPHASTPLVFLALGAVAGAVIVYVGAANGYNGVNPNDAGWFALAGAIANAASGLVFGLVLRRPNRDS